jgi:1,3-beta-glucan synthase
MITGQPDTDSDRDIYSQRLGPSAESLNVKRTSVPDLSDFSASQYTTGSEPYPASGAERDIPLSKEQIEDKSLDRQQNFGFQRVLMLNNGAYQMLRATPSGACIFIATLVRFHDAPA